MLGGKLKIAIAGWLAVLATGNAWAWQAGRSSTPVEFQVHDGYFVVNKFEPDEPASFVVIQDQDIFDKIFGVAMVMNDKANRLPHEAFKTKMALVAIKRGKATWEFDVQSVSADRSTLRIRYKTTETPSDSATFACPMIVSVPKGRYASVVFIENGETVKTVTLPTPQKKPAGK